MKKNEGYLIVVSLFIATSVLLLLGVFLGTVVAEKRNVQKSYHSARALNLAEAGVEKAIWELNDNPASASTGQVNIAGVGESYYTIVVSESTAVVQATGYSPEVVVAARVEREVTIQAMGLGGFVLDHAVVAMDGLTVEGGGHVYGDVLVGTGTTLPASADVTGDITESDLDLPPVPPPPPPYDFDHDGETLNDAVITAGGTYRYKDIKVSTGTLLIAATDSPVTIYAEGLVNILTELRIASGSSVIIHAGGNVNIAGNGVINESGDPTDFILYGAGKCDLTGSSDFYGVVYAPEVNITIAGGANVYGCIIGDTVKVTGGGEVYYDARVGGLEIPGLDIFSFIPGSWEET